MSRRLPLWAGLAVILAVSAGTLLGVLWNRTGTPDAVLELEERELIVLPAEREDSGRAMTWVIDGARGLWLHSTPSWLDREKLSRLGFDVSVEPTTPGAERHYQAQPPREVFVALELGGDAYREHLARWQQRLEEEAARVGKAAPTAERRAEIARELAAAPGTVSRLALVDADRDAAALRARHPDREKVALLRAVLRVRWREDAPGPDLPEKARVEGMLGNLAPQQLTVPPRLLAALEALPLEESGPQLFNDEGVALLGRPSRYRVRVVFGRSLEPWIESIEPLRK
jgi:hypothetical protein